MEFVIVAFDKSASCFSKIAEQITRNSSIFKFPFLTAKRHRQGWDSGDSLRSSYSEEIATTEDYLSRFPSPKKMWRHTYYRLLLCGDFILTSAVAFAVAFNSLIRVVCWVFLFFRWRLFCRLFFSLTKTPIWKKDIRYILSKMQYIRLTKRSRGSGLHRCANLSLFYAMLSRSY